MDDFAQGRNSTPLPFGLATFNWDTKLKDILPGKWKVMDRIASEKAAMKDIFSHVTGLAKCVVAFLSCMDRFLK